MALREGVEAQIKTKGNNIVEAEIKIMNNGSYSFSLPQGGTFLTITVDVATCRNCQQGPVPHTTAPQQERMTTIPQPQESVATPGESVQTIQPLNFHHESTSPTAIDHEQDVTSDSISRGLEESEEVDPEKSRLVCSDNYIVKPQKSGSMQEKE